MFWYYLQLFLPAMMANTIPPFTAKWFPTFLNTSLDFGKSVGGKRIFGDHKTWRGLITGVVGAQLVYWLVTALFNDITHPWFFGLATGFGALFGDAVKSFFKRRVGIPDGDTWFPFDQADWIVGFLVVTSFFERIPLLVAVLYLVLGVGLHLVSKVVGYSLKINDKYL